MHMRCFRSFILKKTIVVRDTPLENVIIFYMMLLNDIYNSYKIIHLNH